MPTVTASIQDMPRYTVVIFYDRMTSTKIGRTLRFTSEELLYELLRRTHANLETINIVEMALRERRPCMVDLRLTDEQFAKLQGR